jgi:hypothetical protein
MTAPPGDPDTHSLLQDALWVLSGFAAIAIILGLLTYSLIQVLNSGSTSTTTTPVAKTRATSAGSASVAWAGLPPPIASGYRELLIVIMCDGETVADVYPDATYYFYIALRPSTDREELSDLLSGAATPFPSSATVFQSRCAKAGVERGDYP